MSSAKKTKQGGSRQNKEMPGSFAGLCRLLPLRPVHDEADYENAIEMLDSLVGFNLNKDQSDYVEALTTLVGAYEDTHHDFDTSAVRGLKALKYLMEHSEMTASDLGELLGNRSLGSKILRGERELSKSHMRILAIRFKVDAGIFL